MLKTIVSGGQTGVDRAALDVAIKLNIPHHGWCPKGRKAEDGIIAKHYLLQETDTDDYSERTKLNIRDSDGTLVLVPSWPTKVTDGTHLTIQEVKKQKKPYLIINLSQEYQPDEYVDWVEKNKIHILNVAGPRESQSPGIYHRVFELLQKMLFATPDQMSYR